MRAYEFIRENENIIVEGSTDIIYHNTSVTNAVNILKQGEFKLASTLGTDVEASYAPKGYPYFLSTTRSKVGDYHRWVGNSAVMFNLDGRIISSRYPVKPIDYWDRAWNYPGSERTRESEDRIFSRDPAMPLNSVTSIHIYLDPKEVKESDSVRALKTKQAILYAKERNLEVHCYVDSGAWRLQNRRREVDPDWFVRNINVIEKPPYPAREYMTAWIELLNKNPSDDLSERAERLRYNMMHYSDTIDTLKNDLHNARKPDSDDYKHAVTIERYMRANKLSNLNELLAYLKKKYSSNI